MTTISTTQFDKYLVSATGPLSDFALARYAAECENHRRLDALRKTKLVLDKRLSPENGNLLLVSAALSRRLSSFRSLTDSCSREQFDDAVFNAAIEALHAETLDHWLELLDDELARSTER